MQLEGYRWTVPDTFRSITGTFLTAGIPPKTSLGYGGSQMLGISIEA